MKNCFSRGAKNEISKGTGDDDKSPPTIWPFATDTGAPGFLPKCRGSRELIWWIIFIINLSKNERVSLSAFFIQSSRHNMLCVWIKKPEPLSICRGWKNQSMSCKKTRAVWRGPSVKISATLCHPWSDKSKTRCAPCGRDIGASALFFTQSARPLVCAAVKF